MIKEGTRFAVVGIATTLLHTGTALTVNQALGFNTVLSNICGFSVAVLFSFTLNTIWSFQKNISSVYLIRFLTVNCLTFFIIILLSNLSDRFGLQPLYGIIMVAFTVPVISFISHKYWTYAN